MPHEKGPASFKEMEREGWHRNAPHYDERAGRMTRQAVSRMLEALEVGASTRLLDVCCGPGYGAGEAAVRGATAVGIDLAAGMVAEAKRSFPQAEFREGDAESLPFPDGSFTAVICPFGLLHLPAPERAIGEAFRVLASGGRYAFSVWCPPERAALLGLALRVVSEHADRSVPLPEGPPMFQFSDPQLATATLERAGFCDVVSEEVPIRYRGRDGEELLDWFEKTTVRTTALFRLQTPEVRRRIERAIVAAAESFRDGDGIEIPCPAVFYVARKP